jgi:hypothetical protein
MTFNDACNEMKKMAGDRYWSFEYRITKYDSMPHIQGYIEDIGHGGVSTNYAGAIEKMRVRAADFNTPPDPAPEDGDSCLQP